MLPKPSDCLSGGEIRALRSKSNLAGAPLWLLPLATWYRFISRVRNIAEHAVVPDDDDPLRNTRTTRDDGRMRGAQHI